MIVATDHPRGAIHVRFLKEAGLSHGEKLSPVSIKKDGLEIEILRASNNRIQINYKQSEDIIKREIRVEYVDLEYGKRTYLVCPETKRRCNEISIFNDVIASTKFLEKCLERGERNAFRKEKRHAARIAKLMGKGGHSKARGRQRESLGESYILEGALSWMADDELEAEINAMVDERKLKKKNRHWKERDAGTLRAFKQGRAAGQTIPFEQYLDETPQYWRDEISEISAYSGRRSVMHLSDAPELNIRALNDFPEPGKAKGRFLEWPENIVFGWSIMLICDCRDGEDWIVRSWQDDMDQPTWQRIECIVHNKKRYWICPVTGKRTETLFWRDGYFASRVHQRLVHPSQRAERY